LAAGVWAFVVEAGGVVAGGVCCARALPSSNIPDANMVTTLVKDFCMQPLSH